MITTLAWDAFGWAKVQEWVETEPGEGVDRYLEPFDGPVERAVYFPQ